MRRSAESSQAAGLAQAKILAGAWRSNVPELAMAPAELEALTPLLIDSGVGGLAWWRIQHGPLAATPAGQQLLATYRMQTLRAAVRERELGELFTRLRAADVEPLLIKGWACARVYAHKGLRPLGDIDVLVRPAQSARAAATLGLAINAIEPRSIDIKDSFPEMYGQNLEELFAASQLVPLGQQQIRVAGPEDHLRILCLHFLKHGAWRPLWLGDIAAALEARPVDFDWERCLGLNPRRADWVACTIGLAHQILGVAVASTPVARRAAALPPWLAPTVLALWQRPRIVDHAPHELMTQSLHHPARAWAALLRRWPNPIASTMARQAALTNMPPRHWQMLLYAGGMLHFMRRVPRMVQGSRRARLPHQPHPK